MAEQRSNYPATAAFKEAVCIDAGRVYDSCCDRDCLEDLRCYVSPQGQSIINDATSVRLRDAEVMNVFVDVEPVSFNRGFYSCDLTFLFKVVLDVFTSPRSGARTVNGVAFFDKKVILFGSEGNVKSFSNNYTLEDAIDGPGVPTTNMPKCVVQTVDPVVLSAHVCELKNCYETPRGVPAGVLEAVGGAIETALPPGTPTVYVTMGLFTVIQLIRNVQMLIPVYDFCIPEKQCVDSTTEPCDAFRRIKFPTDDFFPPRPANVDNDCGCGPQNGEF